MPAGALVALPPVHLWHRRAQPLLGTIVDISVPAANDAEARRWTEAAFERVRAFHAAMSFHEPASDVSAIGRAAAGRSVTVQRCTFDVLRLALELEAASGGTFNVAVADELGRRGRLPLGVIGVIGASDANDASCALDPVANAPSSFVAPSALRSLTLHDDASCCVTVNERVAIDLGGIAKGAAVDAAIEALKSAGAPAGLVNAGGDLATFGPARHAIAIRPAHAHDRDLDHGQHALVQVGYLEEGAFATTAPPLDGGLSALVAPRGHDAAWADRSVSVMSATCMMADAATKLVALMGLEAAPLLRRFGCIGFSLNAKGQIRRVE
ncbi:FAD:protein FMN transferase [soil metagenome]